MDELKPSFRQRFKRAVEDGILLTVKHLVVIGLWFGSGYFVWEKVLVIREQASRGQLSYQFLVANQKELNALIAARKTIDEAVAKADKNEKK